MKKVIYYSDEKHEDHSSLNIHARKVDENFPYIHNSLLWKAVSAFLYYVIAIPLVLLINKIWFGVRIKGKSTIKGVKDAVFMYGNHTQYFTDATIPAMISFPRKAYVIAGAEAVSVKGIGWLVQMLGGLILPNVRSGRYAFRDAVSQRAAEKGNIAIYPEAHIWPYYTGIRDFSPASFIYPVSNDCPACAYVTTYRKRLLPFLPPAITVYVGALTFPDKSLDEHTARQKMRDSIYSFMCEAARHNEVEHIKYIRVTF